jgi:hypothetical protein
MAVPSTRIGYGNMQPAKKLCINSDHKLRTKLYQKNASLMLLIAVQEKGPVVLMRPAV